MAGRGGRGGKKGKRKGHAAGKRELEFKEDGEEYAQILKLLGKDTNSVVIVLNL
jgi:translation initiation factor 1A